MTVGRTSETVGATSLNKPSAPPATPKDAAAAGPITSSQFFGASHRVFRAPALSAGAGRAAVRRARRSDARLAVAHFPTQAAAFAYCDARAGQRLRAWAYEIGAGGKRRFVAASYEAFWRNYQRALRRYEYRLRHALKDGVTAAAAHDSPFVKPPHFYEVVREGFAARLYIDLEFLWEFNKGIRSTCSASNNDSDASRCDVEQMVRAVIIECERAAGVPIGGGGGAVVLDSSTERKFSRHVIFRNIAFTNNVQMGAFINGVIAAVRAQDERLVMVQESEAAVRNKVPFIDCAVYTRNRCFRLAGSSKFGKTARLMAIRRNGERGEAVVSRQLFFQSLVCNVRESPQLKILGERGGGTERVGMKRVRALQGGSRGGFCGAGDGGGGAYDRSPYRKLDEYVLKIVSKDGGGIYTANVLGGGGGTVVYAIKGGYKWCANIGRHHKSNNVMLVADIGEQRMYQKCFDVDCRGFRSAAWDIPNGVLLDDVGGDGIDADGVPDDADVGEVDDAALLRMMDEFDVAQEEVSDEALVQMMEVMEKDATWPACKV